MAILQMSAEEARVVQAEKMEVLEEGPKLNVRVQTEEVLEDAGI
jgi:hypothetical protein